MKPKKLLVSAGFFLVVACLLRVLIGTTLGLSDDEAWYWALSQKLQAAYVVHPPLSVWLIRLGTEIFGNNVLGARASAIFCATLGSYWLVQLVRLMNWTKGAHITAILCITTPLLFFGSILNGPDLPLFLFWIGTMKVSYELGAGINTRPSNWVKLGLLAGLAVLSKYTGAIAVGAAGIWLLTTRSGQKALKTPWPYFGLLITVLCFAPVVFWNAQNGWASFQFQFVHRHAESLQLNPRRWMVFWISQIFLYGPVTLLAWFLLTRHTLSRDLSRRFLAIWALLPGAVFFIQPLFGAFKIHWALFAYIPVLAFLASFIEEGRKRFLKVAVGSGLFITTLGLSSFYVPIVPFLSATFTKNAPDPKHDISNDFYGWDKFGEEFQRLPPSVKNLPVLANRYQLTSQAAFALSSPVGVFLIPHDHFEARDWGGPNNPPQRFLYITDNRYKDPAHMVYPGYNCKEVKKWEFYRSHYLAKQIELQECAKP